MSNVKSQNFGIWYLDFIWILTFGIWIYRIYPVFGFWDLSEPGEDILCLLDGCLLFRSLFPYWGT